MNFSKTVTLSFFDSLKIFFTKELMELLFFSIKPFLIFDSIYKLIILFSAFFLTLLINQNSLLFFILFGLLTVTLISLLRPSVDLKNIRYFFPRIFEGLKIMSLLVILFFIPYSIISINYTSFLSAITLMIAIFCLVFPYNFSFLGILLAFGISTLSFILYLTFNNLLYHFLLMGYLNLDKIINFFCYLFMFNFPLSNLGYAVLIFSPLSVFLIICLLDSRQDFYHQSSGILRSFKLFFINYPFAFIIFNIFRIIVIALNNFLGFHIYIYTFCFLIFYFFYVSIFSTFYVKRIHEQFLIYF